MESQFTKLLQIGIIVEDLDAAVKHYEEDFGMGPWEIGGSPDFPDFKIDGVLSGPVTRAAFLKAFGMELELIEPTAPSAYKTWLEEHGPGIHHIAVLTKDPTEKVLEKCEKLTGKKTWLRGTGESVGCDFSYVDLTKELGIFVELYNEDRSAQAGHDY